MSVPQEAAGLQLFRISGEDLIANEAVMFVRGREAVELVLRRAQLSGRVEVGGRIIDHFADVLDASQNNIATVSLDAKSYKALKTHWMRCKGAE